MRIIRLVILSGLIFFASCNPFGGELISGNGDVITEARNVTDYENVQVSGSMRVHVFQDNGRSVKVETDKNLMPYIEIYNEGSSLVIRSKEGYNLDPSKDIIVYVTAPLFKSIRVSGSGDLISDNKISGSSPMELQVSGSGNVDMEVDVPKLSSTISGSGTISIDGKASETDFRISGSGSLRGFGLTSDDVRLTISGSGDADITANKKLDASVSGSGTVNYKGNPEVNKSVSGSGEVKPATSN